MDSSYSFLGPERLEMLCFAIRSQKPYKGKAPKSS